MEIVKYPDPVLRKKAAEVKLPLSQEDKELLDELYRTMKNSKVPAVGLSAPQLGVSKRMIAICLARQGKVLFNCKMVNPKIISLTTKVYYVPGGEGCFSEPDVHVMVPRKKRIMLVGYDAIRKQNMQYVLEDYLAAVAQHEVDHLEGKLLHDYKKEGVTDETK